MSHRFEEDKKYFFLSYAKGQGDLTQTIEKIAKNYNFFYDVNMLADENWEDIARRRIASNNCVGMVYLLSNKFFKSDPVLKEIQFAQEKPFFCISPEGKSIDYYYNRVIDESDSQEEKDRANEIKQYFDRNRIFIDLRYAECVREGKETLNGWGTYIFKNRKPTPVFYDSDSDGEKERLVKQSDAYYAFDKKAIDAALQSFAGRKDLIVLDVGCADGTVTVSRFSEECFAEVIGVDYNQNSIEKAQNASTDDRFHFWKMDVEDEYFTEKLRKRLIEDLGIRSGEVDMIFMAFTLHHLNEERQSTILADLKHDILRDNGIILIRGSDDGSKICYPNDELLQEFLTRYDALLQKVNGRPSGRYNGRRLYGQLWNQGFKDIKILFDTVDNCGLTEKERKNFYNVGFASREEKLKNIINNNQDNPSIIKEAETVEGLLKKLKVMFINRPDFWYSLTSYLAIARKR